MSAVKRCLTADNGVDGLLRSSSPHTHTELQKKKRWLRAVTLVWLKTQGNVSLSQRLACASSVMFASQTDLNELQVWLWSVNNPVTAEQVRTPVVQTWWAFSDVTLNVQCWKFHKEKKNTTSSTLAVKHSLNILASVISVLLPGEGLLQ